MTGVLGRLWRYLHARLEADRERSSTLQALADQMQRLRESLEMDEFPSDEDEDPQRFYR